MTPAIVHAFRAASAVARLVPPAVSGPAARGIGRLAGHLDRDRRRLVERHLRRVRGAGLVGRELRRSVDEVFASYADYYLQSFRLPSMTPEEIVAGFTQEGYERIAEAREAGNGVIMAMPHLGGWEWAAHWLTIHHDVPVGCVVETLEPPELFEWYRSFRTSLGMEVVGLGPSAGTEAMAMLRDNRVVCLPSDRHVGGVGVEVEFFGERTMLPAGPATLALRTGAVLLPIAVYDRPGGCHGVVRPPIPTVREGRLRDDVAQVTQVLARELEALISAAPEQWHLLQPNWPSDRVSATADLMEERP
ncbi:MAG: phosphatidylinositol mannoside acyltransferase [Actinomycetota bacterium]|nr:phosphatidylinositol mannoside acyltransferase [Actinomycetota bacterium]MEC9395512.1 phosphatidylinositol mannoside acyltransferase [Actinomycetota bacterium]MEC9467222.1 phosphatidylinositol mannoside acyltransferase [Actinomycetota bacterium]MED6327535.1 phosphatidylinositol mannoside acyltransferase [Actinomycetota bacterium]MEE2957412.1 phosphatidylinositol mannoside acyltransferase [Actinomycetota bacterium]